MNTASAALDRTPSKVSIPLHPERGSVSARLARRTLFAYLVFCVAGALPLLLGASAEWQAFGLGLWMPGGGFLAVGGWGLAGFALSLVLFAAAWFLWFFMGAIVLIPSVWLAAALVAPAYVGDGIQPYAPWLAGIIPAAVLVWRHVLSLRRVNRELVRRDELNAMLPKALANLHARATAAAAPDARELSEEQLMALRYAYDRALQPLDQFNGFNIIDQFRESAIRYQLNKLGYALALAQCHYLPNFHGYLSQAQRNLLEKFQDKRVWGYWRLENLLGNLSLDANPIAKDNIMFGGFYNANLSFYTTNTGDKRYMKPGALRFRLNEKKVFEHDLNSIASAARRNFTASPFALYPCEPTHSFSYCNLLGLTAIPVNDRVFGTAHGQTLVPEFRRHFENEFMDADGSIIASRNNTTGLRFQSFDALWTRAGYCWLINGHFPDLSERMWAIIREREIHFDDQGELIIDLSSWMDRLDCGNYRFTGPMPYVQLLCAAAEHGDREVAEAALRGLDRNHGRTTEGGVLNYDISTFAGALSLMGRLMQRHDWRNLVHNGPPGETFLGPLLSDAAYPDVLVAQARSDGRDLNLVLYPGSNETRQPLGFERLTPGATYLLRGQDERTISADEHGRATTTVMLAGRTVLHLAPIH